MPRYLQDDMDDDRRYRPRRHASRDGIRLRSQRGKVGETWWSRRFLDPLEGVDGDVIATNDRYDSFLYRSDRRRSRHTTDSRVSRGKSYARSGQVSDLRITPGKVTALVQGSRRSPYTATIFMPALAPETWEQLLDALAAKALYSAKLLAGDLPHEIEQVFEDAGAPLFPQALSSLRFGCSCPDDARPCKHAAAVLYLLAERFDEDPFQLLAWRGLDKATLLDALRQRRSILAGGNADSDEDDEAAEEVEARDPLHDFWTSGDLTGLKLQAHASTNPTAVLSQLDTDMFQLEGQPLTAALAPVYEAAAQRAEEVALQQPESMADSDEQ